MFFIEFLHIAYIITLDYKFMNEYFPQSSVTRSQLLVPPMHTYPPQEIPPTAVSQFVVLCS